MEREQKSFSTNESPVYEWNLESGTRRAMACSFLWVIVVIIFILLLLKHEEVFHADETDLNKQLIQMNPYNVNHSGIEWKWDLMTSTNQSTSQLKSSDAARLCLASNEASPSGSIRSHFNNSLHTRSEWLPRAEPSQLNHTETEK